MGRVYRIPANLSLTAAGTDTDLLLVLPADDKPCRLAGWFIGQISEVKDEQEEGLRLTVRHFAATVTNGSGGAAVTPATSPIIPAAGFTARMGDTTVATTSGTATILEELSWNIRNTPWERYVPDDQREGITARQGEAIIVRMETTVNSTITAPVTFYVEEY